MQDFQVLPHTADLKIRVWGNTLPELFINALRGMYQSIQPKNSSCSYKKDRLICPHLDKEHLISIDSPDINALLVDFLSETLYLSDVYNEAYLNAEIVELTNTYLKAKVLGVSITGFDIEIKAVTYHNLDIKQVGGVWQTDIVFDI